MIGRNPFDTAIGLEPTQDATFQTSQCDNLRLEAALGTVQLDRSRSPHNPVFPFGFQSILHS